MQTVVGASGVLLTVRWPKLAKVLRIVVQGVGAASAAHSAVAKCGKVAVEGAVHAAVA